MYGWQDDPTGRDRLGGPDDFPPGTVLTFTAAGRPPRAAVKLTRTSWALTGCRFRRRWPSLTRLLAGYELATIDNPGRDWIT